MKYEIYNEDKKEEQVTRLALRINGDGNLYVVAVDSSGDCIENGNLITFQKDGTIYRNHGVNKELGFQQDSNGRVLESPLI